MRERQGDRERYTHSLVPRTSDRARSDRWTFRGRFWGRNRTCPIWRSGTSARSVPTPSCLPWNRDCSRAKRVPEVGSSCRIFLVPLFRGSSRFESLILSHHSRFNVKHVTLNKDEINDENRGCGPQAGEPIKTHCSCLCAPLDSTQPPSPDPDTPSLTSPKQIHPP